MGVAESRAPGSPGSVLAGVVVRRDLVVDGAAFGRATAYGDDATAGILAVCARLRRPDAGYLMLPGAVVSMFNVVDISALSESLQVPVVAVTRGESGGLGGAIRRRFPRDGGPRLAAYAALGARHRVRLRTSHDVFVRCAGCTAAEAARLLDATTLHGAVPEPIRLARTLARAARAGL